MHVLGQIIEGVLWTFIALMMVRFVVDWVQVFARSWAPGGLILVALEVVYSATDPPIKTARRLIPPLRLGGLAPPLGFIAGRLLAYVLPSVNRAIFLRP
ncbi:MAG: YggT family protein [Cellulomonas sp.]|nr:YggT family protein [Cellulomonas sp.]